MPVVVTRTFGSQCAKQFQVPIVPSCRHWSASLGPTLQVPWKGIAMPLPNRGLLCTRSWSAVLGTLLIHLFCQKLNLVSSARTERQPIAQSIQVEPRRIEDTPRNQVRCTLSPLSVMSLLEPTSHAANCAELSLASLGWYQGPTNTVSRWGWYQVGLPGTPQVCQLMYEVAKFQLHLGGNLYLRPKRQEFLVLLHKVVLGENVLLKFYIGFKK